MGNEPAENKLEAVFTTQHLRGMVASLGLARDAVPDPAIQGALGDHDLAAKGISPQFKETISTSSSRAMHNRVRSVVPVVIPEKS